MWHYRQGDVPPIPTRSSAPRCEALADPERFSEIERRVATAAPQLQQILATVLAEGGWLDATR